MLNNSELFKVSQVLKNGRYGSFMAAIGDALQLADSVNTERLYRAFGDKFEQIHSEYEIESTVEDRIIYLQKKLMQGHITKTEYDQRMSIVAKWATEQANA